MTCLELIYEFFKTGLLAVGGGLATVPFLREIAVNYDWFTERELVDMIAVSESTPGPLGVNMATFAGWQAAGLFGGIIATLALVLPSVIIILIVAKFMKRYGENRIVAGAFAALRPAAAGLIGGALFILLGLTLQAQTSYAAASVALYAALTAACLACELVPRLKKLKIHPIAFIAAGAVAGSVLGG
jgi:chromate transporter